MTRIFMDTATDLLPDLLRVAAFALFGWMVFRLSRKATQ